MNRRADRLASPLFRLLLLSLFLFASSCGDENGKDIDPSDLLGTWWEARDGLTLAFESDDDGQTYVMRDPRGIYTSSGDDLLVCGYWYVSGSSLYLEDDAGPLECPPNNHRFVVWMNDEKTNMFLTHLGDDDCAERTDALEDRTWQRMNED